MRFPPIIKKAALLDNPLPQNIFSPAEPRELKEKDNQNTHPLPERQPAAVPEQ
jgi:hypothetical protein